MRRYSVIATGLSLALLTWGSQAQQAPGAEVRVDISSTITGNQQQPRTLYVLPWQDSIAQIRIPAPDINSEPAPIQPLDRQQFLRFIEAQSLSQPAASTASTNNN
ncbi:hypothetical protein WG68_17365 [Arsukibacterium ikkense]|uniref:Uncharacterized protein n=1 Tax=Arsukibacterium ikkense TaxID=336831 RepID=A0A0M2V362_9GAMM|nr:hypothetical protein [Arsukibacterium ikkense]KKO44085.1 hypothetical protein WG68_17365 [Arsukibacterium ikkense]